MNTPTLTLHGSQSRLLRKEKMGGKEFLVAPVVMMKAGVYNGCLYANEELATLPEAWNGRPVIVNHVYGADGKPRTANQPRVLEQVQVGQLFAAGYKDGRLRAEAWIDPDHLGRVHPGMLANLQAGNPIEVSTGVFVDEEQIPGEFGGRRYTGIAKHSRPDHLALIPPGERAACTWADGAGLPRIHSANNQQGHSQTQEDTPSEADPENEIIVTHINSQRSISMNDTEKAEAARAAAALKAEQDAKAAAELKANADKQASDLQTALQKIATLEAQLKTQADERAAAEAAATEAEEKMKANRQAEALTDEQLGALIDARIAQAVESKLQVHADAMAKAPLIAALKANKRLSLSDAALSAMSVEDLENVTRSLSAANYAGRGGPRSPLVNEEDESPDPMPVIDFKTNTIKAAANA
jgi:hypothetical protein